MTKGKLLKLKSTITTSYTIHDGDVFEGVFLYWSVVGEPFTIFEPVGKFGFKLPISTSTVISIIDNRTFETINSVYKIITIEDERNDKIEIILK